MRTYYCNLKFKFLKIDLESKLTYNCHAAQPHPIDFEWLKNKPGQLFNNNINVHEREQMLMNIRNNSCEQNCWPAEDIGAISPRIFQKGLDKTHVEVRTKPEQIDLTVGSDCNLTCSYCCKKFSSAWRRDLIKNGDYIKIDNNDRYTATVKDQILYRISQNELKSTDHYKVLLEEIRLNLSSLKRLIVTGGEPFLDNQFIDILTSFDIPSSTEIQLYTGLGVGSRRFERVLAQLKKIKNLCITVSAEGIASHLEFNRYGIKWQEFDTKIKQIQQAGIKFNFQSQLSNLTLFGFGDFIEYFAGHDINPTFVYQPNMMAINVLDQHSKSMIVDKIQTWPLSIRQDIEHSIKSEPTEQQRIDVSNFVAEFVRRRPGLSLDIFPQSFINWLGLTHVV